MGSLLFLISAFDDEPRPIFNAGWAAQKKIWDEMVSFDVSRTAVPPALRVPRMGHWIYALLLSATLAVGLAVFAPRSSEPSGIQYVEQAPSTHGPWSPVRWWQIRDHPGAGLYRLNVPGSEDKAARDSLALLLSGPFSANVYVNGQLAGSKGRPGSPANAERPGPIDASVPIGAFLKAGANEILLEVSSRTFYGGGVLFQNLSVARAADDSRRNPRQYAIAMSLGGLLMAFAVVFAQVAGRYPKAGFGWLAAGALSAAFALATEVVRSFIDYPYPWHALRVIAIWAGLVAASSAIGLFAAARFGGARRSIAVGAAVALAAALLAADADTKTAVGVASLLLAALATLLQARGEQRDGALALAAVIAPWIGLAITRSSDFLNNSVYVLFALVFIGAIPRAQLRDDVALSDNVPALKRELTIDGFSAPVDEIRAIHAAGNYSEVEFISGSGKLLRAPLTTIAEQAPELVRIHRSHLVRLEGGERLKRGPARGYVLVLNNGEKVPVSRSYLASLRGKIG